MSNNINYMQTFLVVGNHKRLISKFSEYFKFGKLALKGRSMKYN